MRISVITVTYNPGPCLEDTLRSVLGQDYPDREYILIDGGSTDGTAALLARYRDRIDAVVSEPDQGIYDAVNKGLAIASGDVIALLFAGDWYLNDHVLSDAARNMHEGVDVYATGIVQQNPNGWKLAYPSARLDRLYLQMSLLHPATFVKTDVYRQCGAFDLRYRCSADHEFLLRIRHQGRRFVVENTLTVYFRNGGVSSDPRRLAYREDRDIALRYGVSPVRAYARYYQNKVRFTLILASRRLRVDALMKRFTGRRADLPLAALQVLGVDPEHPWFLAEQAGRKRV